MTGPNDSQSGAGATESNSPAQALVDQLAAAFREQVRRALKVELAADPIALAYVDVFLKRTMQDESREPIVSLVAANAGAWFGELVRREIGATWVGDGNDPRKLRLLLEPHFVHFSPIDLAYEVILAREVEPDDPSVPEGAVIDGAFHLRKHEQRRDPDADESEDDEDDEDDESDESPADDDSLSDHDWVMRRLAEAPPLPEDQYYSLTARYETLLQILELLAARHAELGLEPTRYHLNDYVAAIARRS